MQIQVNVKRILYLYRILVFVLMGYALFLFSCVGGGDSYTSKICSYDCVNGIQYYIEVSQDRRKVRYGVGGYISNWVDIKVGGVSYITTLSTLPVFEIKNSQFRIYYSNSWGNWANLCGVDSSYVKGYQGDAKVEVNNGQVRLCYFENIWICGNWVNFDKDYVCGPSVSCPNGYTYNSNTGKCEADPICQNGTYDPDTRRCYIGSTTCPLGNYECLKFSDGKYYCSDIQCGDVSQNSFENIDTPQGANDKKADGQIDENGNCLGTIYIFNGQDRRCRMSGTQTALNNCCTKDEMKLLNLVSIGKCNADEQYLSKLRKWGKRDGKCHYIGEYCAERWKFPGGSICVQKKKTFCCFSSPLARIIQEQGRKQLGISWGTPKNPNCRGFTPSEFQKLDWNKIDFSEWIEGEIIPNVEQNLTNTLNNTIDQIKANIETRY